jgi:UDPglucose--hexose-1-phosphate uridylyltransferase
VENGEENMAETTIETAVQALIDYAVAKSLITEDDEICVRNYLMDMLKLEKWEKPSVKEYGSVDEILDEIVDFAVEKEIIPQSNAWRDLFDTRIMGVFTGMPHEVNAKFKEKYAKSPKEATDWYYAYSEDTNYVRKGRIAKDIRWKYDSEYSLILR